MNIMEEWKNEYWDGDFSSYSKVLQENGEVHQKWSQPYGVDCDDGSFKGYRKTITKYKSIKDYNNNNPYYDETI